jgi:glycosyltransferase involved in cell wall biosynthesis
MTAKRAESMKGRVVKLMEETGAVWHGRTGQKELKKEWMKAGVWCHPSSFGETSCITCMDAQANGAIPITTPTWAIGENVKFGVFVEGNPEGEGLVRSRFVLEVVRMILDPARQEVIRRGMMTWARETFDWDVWARQWEGWARADVGKFYTPEKFEYTGATVMAGTASI